MMAGKVTNHAGDRGNTLEPRDSYQEQSVMKISLLLVAVLLSMFLVALDRTIIVAVCIVALSSLASI